MFFRAVIEEDQERPEPRGRMIPRSKTVPLTIYTISRLGKLPLPKKTIDM